MKPVYVILLVIGFTGGAFCGSPTVRGPFKVGIGKASTVKFAAAAPAPSMTVDWYTNIINKDGSLTLNINYVSANGQNISRSININAACTTAKDNLGNVVAAPPPTAFCTALTNAILQTDSFVAIAAAANKLNF